MDEKNSQSSFWSGLLAAVSVTTTIGLLYLPLITR
jgi:hypothetical protein